MAAPAAGYAPVPSDYPVDVTFEYPPEQSRILALFSLPFFLARGILLIPAFICLYALGIAAYFVAWFGFWAVLFTGHNSAGMQSFLGGFLRWQTRAFSYFYGVTDKYPPFRLGS
jgi:hypothetical protein